MKTLYRQLLFSMFAIAIALPLVIMIAFNIAMRTNVEMNAKQELNSTIETMQKLADVTSKDSTESALVNNLVAALTSTKLSGNTNFYIIRNNDIKFKSENDFEIDPEVVRTLYDDQEEIHVEKINNNNCYVSVISLEKYYGAQGSSMIFVTNTKSSMDNLWTTNLLLISIMFVAVIIAMVYSVITSKNISRPIKAACVYAHEVGNGIFNKEIHVNSNKEIEELYESLNQMAKELKENEDNQKKFYQNISHEFRNPLMSIQGYAEGIEQGILSDNSQAAEVIKQESLKLNGMVTELLTLSKMEGKVYELEMEDYYVRDLMLDNIQSVNGIAIKLDVSIITNIDEKMKIRVDESMFTKAVTNLLSNCIKYAKQSVFVDGYISGDTKVIEIYDDGEGTYEEEMPHLFERFYKGEHGNFGLGLAIAREAVESMNGRITVYNPDDKIVNGKKKIRFRIELKI